MKKKRWKVVGITVAALAGIVLLILLFCDPEEGSGAGFRAGSFQSNNNTSTSSSYSSSDHNLFLARRIAVISESKHSVIERATQRLAASLEALDFVEEVEVFTDERPEPGGLLHDLYILIEMPTFRSRGLLVTGRKVNAEIKCLIGRGLWNARHTYSDHLSPAVVNPRIEISLRYESTARGLESPNVRFQQVGEDIAKQLVEQVKKPLTELAGKFKTLPHLPAGSMQADIRRFILTLRIWWSGAKKTR